MVKMQKFCFIIPLKWGNPIIVIIDTLLFVLGMAALAFGMFIYSHIIIYSNSNNLKHNRMEKRKRHASGVFYATLNQ